MNLLRKILFPFAILYGFVTAARNFLYDKGVFKSCSFNLPVIAVGNLSVGGTGKTPQIEYLIRLLSKEYKIATLSRGYKRKSEGFVLADAHTTAAILGDEPFQFFQKFPEIQVVVDANRKNGIEQLLLQRDKPDVILLDDAYQHRKVKAGFYILLTAYGDIYADDCMLPTGNLRESRSGARRADVVVVTKCPPNLSETEQLSIKKKLKLTEKQELYFSCIAYDDFVYSGQNKISVSEIKSEPKLLLAGIAKPEPFYAYLKNEKDVCLTYPDHHHFLENDIRDIVVEAKDNIIITTEKDYVRLKGKLPEEQLFYLPIQSKLLSAANQFDKKIKDYVGISSGNR